MKNYIFFTHYIKDNELKNGRILLKTELMNNTEKFRQKISQKLQDLENENEIKFIKPNTYFLEYQHPLSNFECEIDIEEKYNIMNFRKKNSFDYIELENLFTITL